MRDGLRRPAGVAVVVASSPAVGAPGLEAAVYVDDVGGPGEPRYEGHPEQHEPSEGQG